MWPLGVIAWKCEWGVLNSMFTALALSDWHPLSVSVCSLPLLCSLSEDWGEPVPSCDEGLLRDAAAVCGPGGECCAEAAGCGGGSVHTCAGDINLFMSCLLVKLQLLAYHWSKTTGSAAAQHNQILNSVFDAQYAQMNEAFQFHPCWGWPVIDSPAVVANAHAHCRHPVHTCDSYITNDSQFYVNISSNTGTSLSRLIGRLLYYFKQEVNGELFEKLMVFCPFIRLYFGVFLSKQQQSTKNYILLPRLVPG